MHTTNFIKKIFFITFTLIISLILQFACTVPPEPVSAKNGMVVSTSSYASKVGVDILKKGGNAIDAAVAVGFALAVTYPTAGNIGGGGFMVIHLADGKNIHQIIHPAVYTFHKGSVFRQSVAKLFVYFAFKFFVPNNDRTFAYNVFF